MSPRVLLSVTFLAAALGASPASGSNDNGLGLAEIVLPGFSPVQVDDKTITMGAGRSYQWAEGLLPASITSRETELVGPMHLIVSMGGRSFPIKADRFRVAESSDHHVELITEGALANLLSVEAHIRIEFDGLATVDLTMVPHGSVTIDQLTVTAPVVRRNSLRLLAYDPKTIYNFGKQETFPLCGELEYKSVLGLPDTERSFWLFTDEPAFPGREKNRPPTTLTCDTQWVRIAQPLLGRLELSAPLRLNFAFLATPVKDLPAASRLDRVVPRATAEESTLGNRQLWWVEALPHYSLPHLSYPPGAQKRLTKADQAAYPGLAANRKNLRDLQSLGIDRLPYMSLRAPSVLDPVVIENEERWRVTPERNTPEVGDGPYRQGFGRPFFSHRAPGFTDYMIEHLDGLAAELPVRGFYFDQGSPMGSGNRLHLPPDERIRPVQASDILAVRTFFKRLATTLYQRGREPLIYVHNSKATVVPAYSFVTALIQGEEYNSYRLKDFDYLSSVNFETIQSTYVSGQFGFPIIWLEEVWSEYLATRRPARYRKDTMAWLESREFERAWRNFMAVALLHDIPVWTLAPPSLRTRLYEITDKFGIDQSRFTGYWQLDPSWHERSILISLFTRDGGEKLAVIVNRDEKAKQLTQEVLSPFFGDTQKGLMSLLGRSVPPKDFILIRLQL